MVRVGICSSLKGKGVHDSKRQEETRTKRSAERVALASMFLAAGIGWCPSLKTGEVKMRNTSALNKGDRVIHVDHGPCVVLKIKRNDPHTVWVKMDSDGIEGTVDVRLLFWRK